MGKEKSGKDELKRQSIDVYRTTDKNNRHTEDGKEILNPTPMQPPLGYKPQLSLMEQIRREVRSLKALDNMEPETEEEADDFEIDDDPPIPSRWENDLIPSIKETRARIRETEVQLKRYAKPPEPAKAAEESKSEKVPQPQK